MRLTKEMRFIAQDIADRLRSVGFAKTTSQFAEYNQQQYRSIGRFWLSQDSIIHVDVYFGPYLDGTAHLWAGFRSGRSGAFEQIAAASKRPFERLGDKDWNLMARSIARRHELLESAMQRMEKTSLTAIEDYKDGQFWFGRYFRLSPGVEAEAFAFLRGLLAPFVPIFKKKPSFSDGAGTMKQVIQFVRVGQQSFRDAVELQWGSSCAVTDCDFRFALRASHILPWRDYPDFRTDPDNGLLLVGTLDALFDRGHITFDDDRAIRISRFVPVDLFDSLQLKRTHSLRSDPFTEGHRHFLSEHRKLIFRGD